MSPKIPSESFTSEFQSSIEELALEIEALKADIKALDPEDDERQEQMYDLVMQAYQKVNVAINDTGNIVWKEPSVAQVYQVLMREFVSSDLSVPREHVEGQISMVLDECQQFRLGETRNEKAIREFFSERFATLLEVALHQISTREALRGTISPNKVADLRKMLYGDDFLANNMSPEPVHKPPYGRLAVLGAVLSTPYIALLVKSKNDAEIAFICVGLLTVFSLLRLRLKSADSEESRMLRELEAIDFPPEIKDFAARGFEIQERLHVIKPMPRNMPERSVLQREAAEFVRETRQKIAENKELFGMKYADYKRSQES